MAIPTGATFSSAGYVYWTFPDTGNRVRIGKIAAPEDGVPEGQMYPNENYAQVVEERSPRPDQVRKPLFPGARIKLHVGHCLAFQALIKGTGLEEDLSSALGEEGARVIVDMAQYLTINSDMRLDTLSDWLRRYMSFREGMFPTLYDTEEFLRRGPVTSSALREFRDLWLRRNLEGGALKVFCGSSRYPRQPAEYSDSIEEDEDDEYWIDTAVVCRKRDGLPITFWGAPEDSFCLEDAEDLLSFGREEGPDNRYTIVCDWMPLTKETADMLSGPKADFLCMVNQFEDFGRELAIKLARTYSKELKKPEHWDSASKSYLMAVSGPLFENSEKQYQFHLRWNKEGAESRRRKLRKDLSAMQMELNGLIQEQEVCSEQELKRYRNWYNLELQPADEEEYDSWCEEDGALYRVLSAERNKEFVADAEFCSGLWIQVSSREMKTEAALALLNSKDETSEFLWRLRTTLNHDRKLSVLRDDDRLYRNSRPARTLWLAWFVALIINELMNLRTGAFRSLDPETYDKMNILAELDGLVAQRDFRKPYGYVLMEDWDEDLENIMLELGCGKRSEIEKILSELR